MVMTDLHPNLGSEGGGFFEVYDKGIMSKYLDITECRSFFSFFICRKYFALDTNERDSKDTQ